MSSEQLPSGKEWNTAEDRKLDDAILAARVQARKQAPPIEYPKKMSELRLGLVFGDPEESS